MPSSIPRRLSSSSPARGRTQGFNDEFLTSRASAPELLDAEALHSLRKMIRNGVISEAHAQQTLRAVLRSPIVRSGHRVLADRAWELGRAMSAYDALYVALTERLNVPLVTCDGKLARSHGHQAQIELYPRG